MRENHKPSIVCLPDPFVANTGLSVVWCNGDKLTTFATIKRKFEVDTSQQKIEKNTLLVLKPCILLFDPLLRKLINESCGIFISANGLKKYDLHNQFQNNHLSKLSKKYRSVLRECIEHIQEEHSKCPLEIENQRYSNCVALLYNLEFIWHLTEVLYIDSNTDDVALPHLTHWIRFHFPESERCANKILQNIRNRNTSETAVDFLTEGVENTFVEYWDTVIGLVMQGNLEFARILLQLHSQSDAEAFTFADKILRTRPVYSVHGESSISEFNLHWKFWQTNVTRRLLSGAFDKHPQLKFVVQIMSGDVSSSIEKLKTYCSSWYQAMIALLLYTEPTVKFYELGHHTHRFVQYFGGTARLNFCDSTVLALFDLDLRTVLKKCQLASDGGWLAIHLFHLLTLCGKLDHEENNWDEDQKTSDASLPLDVKLILDYGSMLMSHGSLWQVGLCYLDQCSEEGRDFQKILLSKIVSTSENKAIKLVQEALNRNFIDVATSICKVEGIKCLKKNQLGKALEWAFRSQDSAFASHLADQFLLHYLKKGVFDSYDLLDNLGPCMLICDRLTFLGKYCEFQRLYIANKLKEAASCLNDLIISRTAPKYFWLTLMTDALPLLENDNEVPLFDMQQTINLSFCLNELFALNESNLSSLISPSLISDFEHKIALIRLAICKNMARTICHQMSTSA